MTKTRHVEGGLVVFVAPTKLYYFPDVEWGKVYSERFKTSESAGKAFNNEMYLAQKFEWATLVMADDTGFVQ